LHSVDMYIQKRTHRLAHRCTDRW